MYFVYNNALIICICAGSEGIAGEGSQCSGAKQVRGSSQQQQQQQQQQFAQDKQQGGSSSLCRTSISSSKGMSEVHTNRSAHHQLVLAAAGAGAV
jgi:hypothetical protein